MEERIFLNDFCTLRSFASTRRAEEYNVDHVNFLVVYVAERSFGLNKVTNIAIRVRFLNLAVL